MRVTVKTTFNKSSALTDLRAASNEALTDVGNQAMKDIDQYVPKDQNGLSDSAETHSDMRAKNGRFKIRWDTDYARYLFHGEVMYGSPGNRTYGPEKLKFTNELARMEWSKYAAEIHKDDWRLVYQKSLEKRL